MLSPVLFYCLLAAAFVQVVFLLFFFLRLAFYRERNKNHNQIQQPVSIVICAKNEKRNLEKNLPEILNQNYPQFEVIVVNDNSTDDTMDLLIDLAAQYPNLQYRNIEQESRLLLGKKYAITVGLRAAQHEVVLLTDADTTPNSYEWIALMEKKFSKGKDIVLGFSPYKKYPGFLNKCIRYETLMAAIQYLSYTLNGLTYMGVGRNLAYRRQLFFAYNVYVKYPELISGDDDLLINEAASGSNVSIQLDKKSFMISEPKKTWDEWYHQKRRHMSTGKYYKFKHRFFLGLFSSSHLLFYAAALLTALYTQYPWWVVPAIVGGRFFLQAIIFYPIMRKLDQADLFILFPVMDILYLFYYYRLMPAVFKNTVSKWK